MRRRTIAQRVQRRFVPLTIMWAIAQRVRRRLSKRESRFSEPTIQVTENAVFDTSGPTTVADSHRSMPLLFNLCRRWAWPAIEWRCQSHPHEADAQDINGDTGLHWAAFGRPPIGAVQALLDACPELATKRNRKGQLPIQIAVSYRAGGDVIRALVQAHPEGAAGALHTACAIGCSADGIRALANEHSVAQRDGTFRQTPLELLNASKHMCRYHARLANLRHIRERQAVLRRSGASDTEADLERFEASVRREVEEWDFFDKAAVLIQAQYKGRALQVDEDETIQIVHACADIANCPPSLLELAILLHPEQLLEQDEEGQVPLHIAIPTSCCSDVIAACPEAARIVNHKGKYPLQIAVEVGRTWNEGVGALVAIHPVVVEGLDLDERLYPLLWSKLHSVDTAASLYASIRSKPTLFDVH